MGFRNYIREFLGAILMLFRLSLQVQQQQQEEKVAKIILFCGFQKLHWGVFGRNFDAFPSFTAMVFSHPGGAF